MNGIFANYLRTMFWSVFGLTKWVLMNILNHVIFPAKIQISTPIDVPYIRVYVWFKDEEKYQPARQNMKFVTRSLLSLINKLHILARQADSIFSVSINSHLDSIYLLRCLKSVEEEELVNLRIVTRYTHTLIWI